jgi:hypothetical protein
LYSVLKAFGQCIALRSHASSQSHASGVLCGIALVTISILTLVFSRVRSLCSHAMAPFRGQVDTVGEGFQIAANVFHLLLSLALIACHAETDVTEGWLPVRVARAGD